MTHPIDKDDPSYRRMQTLSAVIDAMGRRRNDPRDEEDDPATIVIDVVTAVVLFVEAYRSALPPCGLDPQWVMARAKEAADELNDLARECEQSGPIGMIHLVALGHLRLKKAQQSTD